MDPRLRALCVTFVLASFSRRSGALGPVVRCEPCDVGARLLCKPLPKDCAERVREPGCGCCMTCALSSGQPCGMYTRRCASGMTCHSQPGETRPLQALLEGRGICADATKQRPNTRPTPPANELPENIDAQLEERNSSDAGLQTPPGTRGPLGPVGPPAHPLLPSAKSAVVRRDEQKLTQSFKKEEQPGPLIPDQQNFSLETKQEPEFGPCRREMESILSSLKISQILSPRFIRIPNCDKKGFYKKKQCRASKGRKRGLCWCVDKYGQPLPAFDGKERGDAQYYNSESQ